jgi:hypothetical protein
MLETTQAIITKFEEYIGDATALSTVAEVELADKMYQEILQEHEFEFLKKEASGSISGFTINQPDDFNRLAGVPPQIYLGTYYNPFQVVPYTERRIYRGQNNVCYYNALAQEFVFLKEKNDTYSFDYIYAPDALDLEGSNPVWPARFNYAILHKMCTDSDIIQLSEKARAYYQENMIKAENAINDLKKWSDTISNYSTYGN